MPLACHTLTDWPPIQAPAWDRTIHIWTDSSTTNNGTALCATGAAWLSDTSHSGAACLTGLCTTNNTTEIAAMVMALTHWQNADIHIHTDSRLVLGLFEGCLLALEWDGWMDFPWVQFTADHPPQSLTKLLQHLLYLAWSHQGYLHVSWTKAHTDDTMNNAIDLLAKGAITGPDTLDLTLLVTLLGWVDTAPILNSQPLAHLMACIVWHETPPPLSSHRFTPFLTSWHSYMRQAFVTPLNTGLHTPHVWSINILAGLQELLWKSMVGSLPLRAAWYRTLDHRKMCQYSTNLTLTHI